MDTCYHVTVNTMKFIWWNDIAKFQCLSKNKKGVKRSPKLMLDEIDLIPDSGSKEIFDLQQVT